MPTVKCPSCGEKGPIPKQLVGMRIKCRKCHASFQVTSAKAPGPAGSGEVPLTPVPGAEMARKEGIEVDGLDETAWAPAAVAEHEPVHVQDHDHEHEHEHDEAGASFTASPHEAQPACPLPKQYKVLTSKDKFFDGKFDLARLEEALNHFSRLGWVVRSMATPQVAGFSGGPREELVVLLER